MTMTAVAEQPGAAQRSPIAEFYVDPVRVVWQSERGVSEAKTLLEAHPGQPVLEQPLPPCVIETMPGATGGILLDFGREIQGHVQLFTPMAEGKEPVRARVRFGESASEAMADLGGKQNAGNDHAVRDQVVTLPWLGTQTVGPSGFRFVRIDAVDPGRPIRLTQVRAVLGIRDVPRIGSFRCSDERLTRIWEVGADTVHLCMQDYLWDGIKRDRLVWIGDMHPEVSTINAVFGFNEVVPASLDLTRDVTPVETWMNGISSYSMWWVLIHEELWRHHGDRAYLEAQKPYLGALLERLARLVGPDGRERIDGMRFLDWPSSPNQQGVTAGLQALLVMTLDAGGRLMTELGDDRVAGLCRSAADRARKVAPDPNGSKSGAALLSLAGMRDAQETADAVLLPGGAAGVSTFYGFYVLNALARAGHEEAALDLIRTYWGGMLDLGATTFWEDFDLAWTTNATRIDELVPTGKKDIHGDCGAYCYEGFRHSLCHGWASGPTAWLSQHVLGVSPAAPGFARARIAPLLGDLDWAEGTYPTPKGPIRVRHERRPDGTLRSWVTAPADVAIEAVGTSLVTVADGTAVQGITPRFLRCEWLEEPQGIGTREPRLSWIVTAADSDRGQRQTAYRILAASDAPLLEPGKADLWDSGRVESAETLGIVYAGARLESGGRVHWRVMAWDRDGRESPWSEPATFSLGLLEAGDWKGEWISIRDESPLHADPARLHLPPARHYRKRFSTPKPVKRAVLHGTALGLVDWSIDGRRVSDDLFQPGWADYHRRVHARAHDVTGLLAAPGPHCLGAVLADGWYAGYVGYGLLMGYGPHKTGRHIYGKTPALLCQLEIDYADGTRETIVSDASWRVADAGPIREADLLMGETYDARREIPGWDTASFAPDEAAWQPVVPAESNPAEKAAFSEPGLSREATVGFVKPAEIVAYAAHPIRVTEDLPAKSVREHAPGVFIFDLGQNFAGVVQLKVAAPSGTVITLRHGEMLHPDGRLMTENLRRARAIDTYTCKGGGVEVWSPRFTYHGFQFVELTGLPAGTLPPLDTVTGLAVHNDTPMVGRFACSDDLLTRFWRNTTWTQRANFVEVPTDCPQRDERLGWMGDAQIYARTATFNADVAAFFTKWMADVREAQRRDGRDAGAYPDYCPYPFAHGKPGATCGTAWTDGGVICPWTMALVYGDRRMVAEHWDSMQAFMEWRARLDPAFEGVAAGNEWGDWLNVREATPTSYVDLCYHAQSARMMTQMAVMLGKGDDAAAYRRRFEALAESFRRMYLRADGTVNVDTQTACVLALECGLVAGDQAPAVAKQLAERIERNGFRMATGFLGTKSILPALSNHGHHDLACRLFQSRAFPSWGYEVEQGANTVWERWDSFTRERGFEGLSGNNNAAMNSFSHYAFGAVMEWGFTTLAGIDVIDPAYARFRIRPRPPTPGSNPDRAVIDWVKADYDSPRGPIQSHWRRVAGGTELQVRVPANTTAVVHVPACDAAGVTVAGLPVADEPGPRGVAAGEADGVRVLEQRTGEVVLELGSGSYRIVGRE
ncbi:MAG: family 78 glycoside hydrolase catalytic domain [Planctomycetota bacterium]